MINQLHTNNSPQIGKLKHKYTISQDHAIHASNSDINIQNIIHEPPKQTKPIILRILIMAN